MTESEGTPATARSLLVGAIVLCPYATCALTFRNALVAQAVAVTMFTLALCGAPTPVKPWVSLVLQTPVVARHVAVAWIGVGALGTLVGLALGNDPVLLAGQLLAIGLLPLGIVAGVATTRAQSWQVVTKGVVGGTAVGAAISIAASLSGITGVPGRALYLPNHVSVSGSYLLAVLLCIGAFPATRDQRRLPWYMALSVLGLYMVMLGSRSLLLLTPACIVAWALLARNLRAVRALAATLVGVVLAATLLFLGVLRHTGDPVLTQGPLQLTSIVGTPSPDSLSLALPGGTATLENASGSQVAYVSPPIGIPGEGSYGFGGEILSGGSGTGYFGIRWLDRDDGLLDIDRVYAPAQGHWQAVRKVVRSPSGSTALQFILGTKDDSPGTWSFRAPAVDYLGSALFVSAHRQWAQLKNRHGRLADLAVQQDVSASPSLAFRLEEARAVWSVFVNAPLSRKLVGHGLGATFQHRLRSFKGVPQTVQDAEQNYIHNYYLYLLFKVGVIGAVLIVGAAGCFLWSLWSTVHAHPPGPTRARVAAVAVAWVGYLVWGIVAPELADFRIAPLWGLAIAVASAESVADGK